MWDLVRDLALRGVGEGVLEVSVSEVDEPDGDGIAFIVIGGMEAGEAVDHAGDLESGGRAVAGDCGLDGGRDILCDGDSVEGGEIEEEVSHGAEGERGAAVEADEGAFDRDLGGPVLLKERGDVGGNDNEPVMVSGVFSGYRAFREDLPGVGIKNCEAGFGEAMVEGEEWTI